MSEDLGMRTVMEDLNDLGMYPLARVALNRSMSRAINLDGKFLSSVDADVEYNPDLY